MKVEHQGYHATFLDLDITVKDGIFIYKLFDKRDAFPFYIVRMPHLSSNILKNIFYGSIFSEILRIARCTLLFSDFLPRISDLFNRMLSQGANAKLFKKQIKKALLRHHQPFIKFKKSESEILELL